MMLLLPLVVFVTLLLIGIKSDDLSPQRAAFVLALAGGSVAACRLLGFPIYAAMLPLSLIDVVLLLMLQQQNIPVRP